MDGPKKRLNISFKHNGEIVHENHAKIVWECYWGKKTKSYNEFLFDDYPCEDFDVEKIDEIVHSRYYPSGRTSMRYYWM